MNYRQKCKQKGKWAFVKYKGDAAIYAVCQNCGFTQHDVYDIDGLKIKVNANKCYKYCPGRGLNLNKKQFFNQFIDVKNMKEGDKYETKSIF